MKAYDTFYKDFWKNQGFSLQRRDVANDCWDLFLENQVSYVPSFYSNSSVAYQLAYQLGAGGEWLDLSGILSKEGAFLAALPLSVSSRGGHANISSHGFPVQPPLFADKLPLSTRKSCIKMYLDVLGHLSSLAGCRHWISEEILLGEARLSEWHLESMQRSAFASLHQELFVNLKMPLDQIKSKIRRRYRTMINLGLREWSSEIWHGENCKLSQWEEFRALHLHVAGRVTRAPSTWEQQFEAVKSKQSLVVVLRESKGKMVGAALFALTKTEANYAVGAYDRSLFDKPIGHVAQFIAIQEFQRLGLSWYRIGARPFAGHDPVPSAKELSIGDFKQGFATCTFPKIRLRHPVGVKEFESTEKNGE